MAKKFIILDTETTGLEVRQGHKIIEIGAVVLNDRKKSSDHFHAYINPGRLIDDCLLYTSPSPRDPTLSRMPSSA